MDIQNVIETTGYIESINKLDGLINELLYSKDSGFINLSSKDAIVNAQKILEKFNYEADKIARDSGQSDFSDIVNTKRSELKKQVKNHFNKEALNWSYSVFDDLINNCILRISINSKDKESFDDIVKNIHSAVSWISLVQNFSPEQRKSLLNDINLKLNKAIEARDDDFIDKNNPLESQPETYFKIRNLITANFDEFSKLDLNDFKYELSDKDILFFNKIKTLAGANKNKAIDDINLIDYSIDSLNIFDINDKYNLVEQIQDDISSINDAPEAEKVQAITRRIAIFKDKSKYYKKLLGS